MLYLFGHDVAFILDWRIKLVREIFIRIYRLIQLVYWLLGAFVKFPTVLLLSRKHRLSWLPWSLIVIHSLLTKRWKSLGIVLRDLTLLISAIMEGQIFIIICFVSTYHGIKFWLCYVFHLFDGIACEVKLGRLLFINCNRAHVSFRSVSKVLRSLLYYRNIWWLLSFIKAFLVNMYLNTFWL